MWVGENNQGCFTLYNSREPHLHYNLMSCHHCDSLSYKHIDFLSDLQTGAVGYLVPASGPLHKLPLDLPKIPLS